ncbi:MAG: hypothetical protein V3U11_11545, partial [Planctomycetota bacterium]
ISWGDCGRLGKEIANMIGVQIGDPIAIQDLQRILDEVSGEMVAVVKQTKSGYMVKSNSPYGNMYLAVALALGGRSFVKEMPGVTRAQDPSEAQTRRLSALLQQVVDAQTLYRASAARDNNKNGVGEYGTIPELLATGCFPANLLGRHIGDGVYETDKHLIKVMLPRTPANQEQSYAAIAWPAKRKRGTVFAITEAGLPQVNNVIAQVEGITECDPRDLFVDGRFDRPLVEGWRPVATASEAARARLRAAADAQRAQGAEERRHYQAVLLAERSKRINLDAIRALQSSNDDLVARAAYVAGMLKAKDAVPSLCQLAATHRQARVRQQAMAALTKIRDTRSAATSIRVLQDKDVKVRAFAATNLGRLRALASVKPLTTLLANPVEGDGADHVAALLALTDIGDPRCLALAAASVKNPNDKMAEALTYMFQKISPTMAPDKEVKPLLVALDSNCLMLRRYVIQRLGILKDVTTLTALENQLAKEDRQLQPLISVSLNAIRGDSNDSNQFRARARAWLTRARESWRGLTRNQRFVAMGGGLAVFILVVLLMFLGVRRRHRRMAEAWANMVNPSEDYSLEHGAEAHGYDHYDEEGEHHEGEGFEPGDFEAEHFEAEHVEGEHLEGEHLEGEHLEPEHAEAGLFQELSDEGEHTEGKDPLDGHFEDAHRTGGHFEGLQDPAENTKQEDVEDDVVTMDIDADQELGELNDNGK